MAFDAFLKIDGIDGESTDKTHPGEIEISSFSWGVSNPSSVGGRGGGGGAGKAVAPGLPLRDGDEQGVAEPDARVRDRQRTSARATLTCRRGGVGGFEFLKIRARPTASVSSYELGGDNTPPSTSPNSPIGLAEPQRSSKIDFLYTVQRTARRSRRSSTRPR